MQILSRWKIAIALSFIAVLQPGSRVSQDVKGKNICEIKSIIVGSK